MMWEGKKHPGASSLVTQIRKSWVWSMVINDRDLVVCGRGTGTRMRLGLLILLSHAPPQRQDSHPSELSRKVASSSQEVPPGH